jgi:hypothetical protein
LNVAGQPNNHSHHQQQAEPLGPEHLHTHLLHPHPLQTRRNARFHLLAQVLQRIQEIQREKR